MIGVTPNFRWCMLDQIGFAINIKTGGPLNRRAAQPRCSNSDMAGYFRIGLNPVISSFWTNVCLHQWRTLAEIHPMTGQSYRCECFIVGSSLIRSSGQPNQRTTPTQFQTSVISTTGNRIVLVIGSESCSLFECFWRRLLDLLSPNPMCGNTTTQRYKAVLRLYSCFYGRLGVLQGIRL